MKSAQPLNHFRPQSIYEYYHNNGSESSSEDEETFEKEKATSNKTISDLNAACTSSMKSNSPTTNKRKCSNLVILVKTKTSRTKAGRPKISYDSTGRNVFLDSYTKEKLIVAHAIILLKTVKDISTKEKEIVTIDLMSSDSEGVHIVEERSVKENKMVTIDVVSSDPKDLL